MDPLAMPDSPAVRAALKLLTRFAEPALTEHSIRCWSWAVLLADASGVRPADPELLCTAALLHDIGLTEDFDAVRSPYETAGGSVAWAVAAGAGWSSARCDRIRDVVIRHNWPSVPVDDPDGHLLERATALDVRGAGIEEIPRDAAIAVLTAHPRGDFADRFAEHLRDQASRKPTSAAHRLASPAVLEAIAAHPHDRSTPAGTPSGP